MQKKASLNEKLLCDIAILVETECITLKNTLQNLGQQEFAQNGKLLLVQKQPYVFYLSCKALSLTLSLPTHH